MKIKRIICSVATVAVFALLATSCGKSSTTKKPSGSTKSPVVTTKKGSTTKKDTTKKVTTERITTQSGGNYSKEEIDFKDSDNDKASIQARAFDAFTTVYNDVLPKLDSTVDSALEVMYKRIINIYDDVDGSVDEMKAALNAYYKKFNENIDLIKQKPTTLEARKEQVIAIFNILKEDLKDIVKPVTMTYINMLVEEELESIAVATSMDTVDFSLGFVCYDFEDHAKNVLSDALESQIEGLIENLNNAKAELNKLTDIDEDFDDYEEDIKDLIYTLTSTVDEEDFEETLEMYYDYAISLYYEFGDIISVSLDNLKAHAMNLIDSYARTLEKYKDITDLYSAITSNIEGAKGAINNITTADGFKDKFDNYEYQMKSYISNAISNKLEVLIEDLIDEIDNKYNTLYDKIDISEIKDDLSDAIDGLKAEVNNIYSLDYYLNYESTIYSTLTDILTNAANNYIGVMTTNFAELIEEYEGKLSSYISDKDVKDALDLFTEKYSAKIEAIETVDDVVSFKTDTLPEMADDFADIVAIIINKAKATITTTIEEAKSAALAKLTDSALIAKINTAYSTFTEALAQIKDLETYASELEEAAETAITNFKKVIAESIADFRLQAELFVGYITTVEEVSTFDYIPDAMKYSSNLANPSSINYDFTNFVNVSDINYGGFGEQWNMVTENLMDADKMLSVINKANSFIQACCNTLVNYYESDTCDEINYSINNDNYQASVELASLTGPFVLTFKLKKGITIPLFGSVTPEITYTITTTKTIISVKLSETNKLRYEKDDDHLIVALEYGISKGNRTSYISFSKESDGSITGHLYEYSTLGGKTLTNSCADFYITDEYVSAIGNKASGITGMDCYICEVYNTSEGKLLGYEVREEKSLASFDTLWFNLSDVSGFTNVKVTEDGVYVNDSETVFKVKKNLTTRRYDIELRKRYFFEYNEETKEYIQHEVEIPMLFIQEDNFDTYSEDVTANNSYITTSEVEMDENDLAKVKADYDECVPAFKENKGLIDDDYIIEFIDGE